jgi:hypothetical protein
MKKTFLITSSIFFCLVFSLTTLAQAKSVSCGTDAKASVTIDNTAGYNILSDINQPYVTQSLKGEQPSVMFQIGNCSYDLVLNLNNSKRYINFINLSSAIFPNGQTTSKFFNMDRVASVPVTTTPGFISSPFCMNGWARNADGSVPKNSDGTVQDNYAGCGSETDPVTGQTQYYVRRNVGNMLTNNYRLRFQNSPFDGGTNAGGTDYIKVYRPDASTWVIMPENNALSVLLNDTTPIEFQNTPFKMTVKKL